jgi:hypothetical protein
MRIAPSLAAAACVLTLAYAGDAAAIMSNITGFIQPKGGKVTGPLVITSMQCAVDPVSVQRCYLVYNSAQASNIWISVDDFQGPLFLAAGDKLEGREDWTKAGVIYTAFKKP